MQQQWSTSWGHLQSTVSTPNRTSSCKYCYLIDHIIVRSGTSRMLMETTRWINSGKTEKLAEHFNFIRNHRSSIRDFRQPLNICHNSHYPFFWDSESRPPSRPGSDSTLAYKVVGPTRTEELHRKKSSQEFTDPSVIHLFTSAREITKASPCSLRSYFKFWSTITFQQCVPRDTATR